jgi:hypothetical protein
MDSLYVLSQLGSGTRDRRREDAVGSSRLYCLWPVCYMLVSLRRIERIEHRVRGRRRSEAGARRLRALGRGGIRGKQALERRAAGRICHRRIGLGGTLSGGPEKPARARSGRSWKTSVHSSYGRYSCVWRSGGKTCEVKWGSAGTGASPTEALTRAVTLPRSALSGVSNEYGPSQYVVVRPPRGGPRREQLELRTQRA